jgi:sarcosine oxidase subunit beta
MGRTTPNTPHDHSITSSWQFLDEMATTVCHFLPAVGNLRVLRQWAGSYNMSLDRQPIIGTTDLEEFYLACGFSGHGFMFSPMTGLLLSEIILKEKNTIDISDLNVGRFQGKQVFAYEKSVV